MGRIRILSDIVANKIAAGEVVERPASVVKELLENSLDAGATEFRLEIEAGGRRLIRLADNGCGMTPQTRARIFEPFFTTKESTGTGLGLWVSSEILAKHRATVRVASRPDDGCSKRCGTVFMIFFPEDGIGVPQLPAMVAETENA